jgi:hypothetical protein
MTPTYHDHGKIFHARRLQEYISKSKLCHLLININDEKLFTMLQKISFFFCYSFEENKKNSLHADDYKGEKILFKIWRIFISSNRFLTHDWRASLEGSDEDEKQRTQAHILMNNPNKFFPMFFFDDKANSASC